MYRIDCKPMSVNQVWQGRRFKTGNYKIYEQAVGLRLPSDLEVPSGDLFLRVNWGVATRASDWDNPIKPFQDILQKRYGFNDNRIRAALISIEAVGKGNEFIEFDILPLDPIAGKLRKLVDNA